MNPIPFRKHDPRTRQVFYSTVAPDSTKIISCDEADCQAYREGFAVLTETDSKAAWHIRKYRTGFVEDHMRDDGKVGFIFEPGIECFGEHRVAALPPRLLHLPGRGGAQWPSGREIAESKVWRPADWLENFEGETDKVSVIRKREGL